MEQMSILIRLIIVSKILRLDDPLFFLAVSCAGKRGHVSKDVVSDDLFCVNAKQQSKILYLLVFA